MKNYIEKITLSATEALIEELDTTPKPGLVDRLDSGAHSDMDYALFLRSIGAFFPYLKEFACASLDKSDAEALAYTLKDLGLRAEQAMFAATGGVNTHKGAIFALALLIGAVVSKNIDGATSLICAQKQVSALAGFLAPLHREKTHGKAVREKYGAGGAFGQALDGYRDMLGFTLPLFDKYEAAGLDQNSANVMVLLNLMTFLDDTNVMHRAGKRACDAARAKAGALLDNYDEEALQCLCTDFKKNNISFGGCADMLMLSIFVRNLFRQGILK